MKVNFMIPGAQKCGTTTLFLILAARPSIVGCRKKEPHFFCLSKDWKRELPNYEKLFDQKDNVLYFEASTSYTFYPLRNLEIWNDIFAYNPDMKFIYLVRNPVDRVVSNYMHRYERGYSDASIEEDIIKKRVFIDVTRYYTQIIPYVKKFGRNNVLVIDFDDLNKKRKSALQTISEFLGVDFEKFQNYENIHANVSVGGYKIHPWFERLKKLRNSKRVFRERPELPIAYKRMILNMLDLEINELQKLMNKDLSHWKLIEVK